MIAPERTKMWVTGLMILGLGTISWTAWLGEVLYVKGWQGLRWLDGYPTASVLGVVCVVLSVALPIHVSRGSGLRRVALFVAVSSPIALLSFELARSSLHALHSRSVGFMQLAGETAMARDFVLANAGGLLGAAALTAVGFTIAARAILAPVNWRMAGLFLLALAFVWPMSVLTIWAFPALSGATDYLSAVKMGYPVLWTNVLMALASGLGSRAPHGRVVGNGAAGAPAT